VSAGQEIILEFSLKAAIFDAAGEAASKTKRVLQQIGVRADIIRRIAISAYEGEMNTIIHSCGGTMRVVIFPDRTEMMFEDQGPGIADTKLAMEEGYSTAPDYVREMGFGAGMGLPNMARCSDEFDIQSEIGVGTKIKMVVFH
jgi:serine/threonine-protein kinase RsbT